MKAGNSFKLWQRNRKLYLTSEWSVLKHQLEESVVSVVLQYLKSTSRNMIFYVDHVEATESSKLSHKPDHLLRDFVSWLN